MLFHAAILGQSLQTQAVTLTFTGDQMRVGRSQHQIDHIGMCSHDFRQRFDRIFDALAGPQQTEGEQHHLPCHSELLFVETGILERDVWNAVRDDVHFGVGYSVGFPQDLGTFARHHHQAVAAVDQLLHDLPLGRVGVTQHRMQGRHNRHAHFLQQRQQVAARGPAIDAELVLHAEHLRVIEVQEIRRAAIRIKILLDQFELDPWRILVALYPVIHRSGITFRQRICRAHSLTKVPSEGGDPAQPGFVIS